MQDREQNYAVERAELDAVLASGIFARAPALANMLRYICEKTFAGEGAQIKEYNIAVDAFRRGPEFDQKRDSIVRVEAHRLRKRLKEFYASEGAARPLRIEIPPGSYTPSFIQVSAPEPEAPPEPPPSPPPPVRRRVWWPAAAGIFSMSLLLAAMAAWQGREPLGDLVSAAGADSEAASPLSEVRIRCGASSPFSDRRGQLWFSDRYYEGGRAVMREVADLQGTLTPELFAGYRAGAFRYSIPLKPGVYELTLYFAEPPVNVVTDRLFDVRVNGRDLLTEFDILAEAGAPDTALIKVWRDIEPDEDGILRLEFADRRAGALVNAIMLMPGTPGRLRPILIAAREQPYTDTAGRLFTEDQYFQSGRLVKRSEGIAGTEDPELYRGERFGNFSYAIPVTPGSTYTAVLHFAETWFGGAGAGGAGSRTFDVYCNGARLLPHFDPYDEIGGPFLAARRTFPGLRPTPNGKLLFQFVPSRNYAMINALEILDEGGSAEPAPSAAR